MLKHLDLFSGIGGWTLGFHATEEIQTVGFCEIEDYPQQILKQHYPDTPIFEDVRKLDYEQLRTAGLISDTQRIDILTCSYPCQPFSVAGKKRGEEDSRHLWPEVHRLIRDDRIRPMYVLGENVGGHIRLGLDTVSEDMERCGYRWRCFSIEASCIGANHRRQRVWWIAEDTRNDSNSNSKRPHRKRVNKHRDNESNDRQERESRSVRKVLANERDTEIRETPDVDNSNNSSSERKIKRKFKQAEGNEEQERKENSTARQSRGTSEVRLSNTGHERNRETADVADTNSKRRRGRKTRGQNAEDVRQSSRRAFTRNWDVEPNVGRVANGVPNRVHRLKALGNAIVPQMAYYIGQALIKDFQHKNHN
jgi:DNA (cytosine-5)-methyltransferase 1